MREEAIDQEGIDRDHNDRAANRYRDCLRYCDAFLDGVWILQAFILEREVLMVGLDRVENEECNGESAVAA